MKTRNDFVSYINIMELCFDISPNIFFIETAIKELTGLGKATWIDLDKEGNMTNKKFLLKINFDAVKTRTRLINKVQNIDNSYTPPIFPKLSFVTKFERVFNKIIGMRES